MKEFHKIIVKMLANSIQTPKLAPNHNDNAFHSNYDVTCRVPEKTDKLRLTASLRFARQWFAAAGYDVYVRKRDGVPALQVPLSLSRSAIPANLFIGDFKRNVRGQDGKRKLWILTCHLTLFELEKSCHAQWFKDFDQEYWQPQESPIGYFEVNETDNTMDYVIRHLHGGKINEQLLLNIATAMLSICRYSGEVFTPPKKLAADEESATQLTFDGAADDEIPF